METQNTIMAIQLRVVKGRPRGKRLLFPHGEYVFGRGAECHVRPNSDWVSRQHCLIKVTSDTALIRDLGSRNGTLVNGVRLLNECPLADGDMVEVGPLVFEVQIDRGSPETPQEIPPTSALFDLGTGAPPAEPESTRSHPKL